MPRLWLKASYTVYAYVVFLNLFRQVCNVCDAALTCGV